MYFGAWWGEADGEWWGDTEAAAEQAGFTSLLGLWVGGAAGVTVGTPQAGVRGLLAFWFGGASSGDEVVVPVGGGPVFTRAWLERMRARRLALRATPTEREEDRRKREEELEELERLFAAQTAHTARLQHQADLAAAEAAAAIAIAAAQASNTRRRRRQQQLVVLLATQ